MDEGTRRGGVLTTLRGLAEALGLSNAMEARHGRMYATRYETYVKKGETTENTKGTTPDHVLISAKACSEGVLMRVGVAQKEVLNSSDHRPLMVELNWRPCWGWLGAKRGCQRRQRG